jgi:hypothetical protein
MLRRPARPERRQPHNQSRWSSIFSSGPIHWRIRSRLPATSHQAGSLELSERLTIQHSGAAMEGIMAVDTVVDAELWLILAAMIGWVALGCHLTARHRRSPKRQTAR